MQAGQPRPCTQRKARIDLSQANTGSSIAGKRRKKRRCLQKRLCYDKK